MSDLWLTCGRADLERDRVAELAGDRRRLVGRARHPAGHDRDTRRGQQVAGASPRTRQRLAGRCGRPAASKPDLTAAILPAQRIVRWPGLPSSIPPSSVDAVLAEQFAGVAGHIYAGRADRQDRNRAELRSAPRSSPPAPPAGRPPPRPAAGPRARVNPVKMTKSRPGSSTATSSAWSMAVSVVVRAFAST